MATLRHLYGHLRSFGNAKRANVRRKAGSLSFAAFVRLRSEFCYYCAGDLPPSGIGLDRIDPARGYDEDNVLPCCTRCNCARGGDISVEEFKLIIDNRMRSGLTPWPNDRFPT
jgi:hypothetical protein